METSTVMAGLVPAIHAFSLQPRRGCPAQGHKRPAQFVLEEVHGIDSARFQVVSNHLDAKGATPCGTRISFSMNF
jgi:hypothetical protein